MSSVQTIPLKRLFDDVQKEGFSLGVSLTDAEEIALKSFIFAWAHANGVEQKQCQRLFEHYLGLNHFRVTWSRYLGDQLYGPSVFEELVEGIFGFTVDDFLNCHRRERRVLLCCDDLPHASCLLHLVAQELCAPIFGPVRKLNSKKDADRRGFFEELMSGGPQRPYGEELPKGTFCLRATTLESQTADMFIEFPPIGVSEGSRAFLTIVTPDELETLGYNLATFLSTHAQISVPSLADAQRKGISWRYLAEAEFLRMGFESPSDEVLRVISERFEGAELTHGRQMLLNCVYLIEGRGLNRSTDSFLLEKTVDVILRPLKGNADKVPFDSIKAFIASSIRESKSLPTILGMIERESYIYAARLTKGLQPERPVRLQDVADLLGIPRQTASRKWHQFELDIAEFDD